MPMGQAGGADMAAMEMPLPDNTLPMMTGSGPFGPIEMGGMFTVLKVREDLAPNDYKDPGWYRHPDGTVAHEVPPPSTPPSRPGHSSVLQQREVGEPDPGSRHDPRGGRP